MKTGDRVRLLDPDPMHPALRAGDEGRVVDVYPAVSRRMLVRVRFDRRPDRTLAVWLDSLVPVRP